MEPVYELSKHYCCGEGMQLLIWVAHLWRPLYIAYPFVTIQRRSSNHDVGACNPCVWIAFAPNILPRASQEGLRPGTVRTIPAEVVNGLFFLIIYI